MLKTGASGTNSLKYVGSDLALVVVCTCVWYYFEIRICIDFYFTM